MSAQSVRRATSTPKLSSEERRAAILRAVRRVFSDKGFDGTTTRALADAAGVSEALLFKHFPTKEALFSAMKLTISEAELGRFERIKGLESSTQTLVLLVHFLVSRVIEGWSTDDGDDASVQTRLMLRSLAQDGDFARLCMKRVADDWVPKVRECIHAAVKAGEAKKGGVSEDLAGWFTHHVAWMVMIELLPQVPALDYGVSRGKLVEQAVWFTLRGIGITDEAIARYYQPDTLALGDR